MSSLPQPLPRRGRSGACLGLTSALLLAAAFRWAHHWGPLAETIVGAWALATIAALGASAGALSCRGGSRRLARLGLCLGLLSVVAVAAGAGVDPAAACGGG